jgi:sugar phosphate isomerase/epimerase
VGGPAVRGGRAAGRVVYHVDCKDTRLRPQNGRAGVLGSHLPWGDPRRGWDFVSTGHGDVPWEDSFRALEFIGYTGPISIEWEDAGMDASTAPPTPSGSCGRCSGPSPPHPSTPPYSA